MPNDNLLNDNILKCNLPNDNLLNCNLANDNCNNNLLNNKLSNDNLLNNNISDEEFWNSIFDNDDLIGNNDFLNDNNEYNFNDDGFSNEIWDNYILNNKLEKIENPFDIILCDNEDDLINNFLDYITLYDFNKTRLIHWSIAEPLLFQKKCKIKLPWFDLLTVFKFPEYPIVIKDCHGFGIKKIVNSLNKHGLISLKWNDLDDGLLSAFIAKDIYENKNYDNNNNNDDNDEKSYQTIINLIDYNKIDCLALHVLIDFIRNYSTTTKMIKK